MKKNKPWLLVALSVIIAFTLAACGSTGTQGPSAEEKPAGQETQGNQGTTEPAEDASEELMPEEGAKLVVWESNEEKAFIEEVGKRFTEKYGVPVTVEVVAGGDQGGRLSTDGPAGLAADVLTMPHDHIGPAVKANLILPNDYFEEETRSIMTEAALTATTYDGVLYGYPKSVETYALFYNKDLVPNPPKTWDEVITFAKQFNDPDANKYAIMWELGNFYFGYGFFASTGGYVFGDNNTNPKDIGLNNEGAVKGMALFQSLKEILPVNTGDITYDVKSERFTSGNLAMDINGPWAVGSYREAGVNFGVTMLPAFPTGEAMTSFSGVKAYYVNSYSKFPNAARLFSHFASGKEVQLLNFEMTGQIPANKEAAADPKIVNDPITNGFSGQFANSTPMPSIPEMASVWEPGAGALTTIWNDGADVKATLDANVKTIQDKIATQ